VQGVTWSDRVVSVNLQLESPITHTTPDIASVIYVACTRVNELSNLFVAPIFPSVWQRFSRSEHDETQERDAATEECREVLGGVGLLQ